MPEPVYDQVYAGCQPIPVALRDIKTYVKQIQEEIERFDEEYGVRYPHTMKPSPMLTTFYLPLQPEYTHFTKIENVSNTRPVFITIS